MRGERLGAALRDLESGAGTLVVVPSITVDDDELAKIPGAIHFEERMLWMLQVLRNPLARVVYVTSEPLPERLVDYSVSLTGMPTARERLVLVSCNDPAPVALTHKVLSRPDVLGSIRTAIGEAPTTVMMCHIGTTAESELAAALGVELFSCPPDRASEGTKSASRRAFRDAGVPLPDGAADLRDRGDVIEALVALRREHPGVGHAVIKLNESFAGGGNAIFEYPVLGSGDLRSAIVSGLDGLTFVSQDETPERYFEAFGRMGGVVEEMIEGDRTSPSVQCVIGADGGVRVASTHEQILGGPDRQTFFGCRFPARPEYNVAIGRSALLVADRLGARGVKGHMSIDFVCRPGEGGWEHFAIEVNLRMGGATAPISFLESATGRRYDADAGEFCDEAGRSLFYTSADRIQADHYRSLTPAEVIDEADRSGLHFDPAAGAGSLFYMLGALQSVGKLGLVSVDQSPAAADSRYDAMIASLDLLGGQS